MSDPVSYAHLRPLIQQYAELKPNARRVLEEVARRLLDGQRAYGADFDDDRDMVQEAREEALDLAVYLAVTLTQVRRGKIGT